MNKNVLVQTILENHGGIIKGSSKRVISYIIGLLICFVVVFPTLQGKEVPLALLAMLISLLLTLLGFGTFSDKPPVPADPIKP